MRFQPANVCLLISILAFFNLLMFAVFAPKNWGPGRLFRHYDRGFNDSVVPNTTMVFYEIGDPNLRYKNCEEKSELLVGNIAVNLETAEEAYWNISLQTNSNNSTNSSLSTYLGQHSEKNGSETSIFEPLYCSPTYTIAIIIPFRDRESHLRILLGHLIPVLRRQLIRYSIFVISQAGDGIFNKGRLMNTGFEFALATGKRSLNQFDCFIFQDVDLLVEHDDLFYRCTKGNTVDHLSTAINKFDYKPVCCGMTVGGVLAFKKEHYKKVNGFPNSYWGWGGEDDDIANRMRYLRIPVVRPNPKQGRFTMIKHEPDKLNPYNQQVIRKNRRTYSTYKRDGLSTLDTTIIEVKQFPLFTFVNVDVGNP